MKNIQLEYLCAEVGKWEQIPGVTPPMVMRLLKMLLGIGMQPVIDNRGVYPCYYFNRMAVLLRSRHPKDLVRVAADCGSFVVGRCTSESMNYYEVDWIASPLFLDEWALKQCIRDRVYEGTIDDDTTEETTQKLDSKMRAIFSLVNNRRYKYIILSGGIQVKTWTDSLRAGMAAHGRDISLLSASRKFNLLIL